MVCQTAKINSIPNFHLVCYLVNVMLLFDVERIRTTLSEVGPPVLNGGISTLLAFILLAFSKSYIFQAFFRVRVSFCYTRFDVCIFSAVGVHWSCFVWTVPWFINAPSVVGSTRSSKSLVTLQEKWDISTAGN